MNSHSAFTFIHIHAVTRRAARSTIFSMEPSDSASLLPADNVVGERSWTAHPLLVMARHRVRLLTSDISNWGMYYYRKAHKQWPLGPIRLYPPAESANFVVVNNERERLSNSQKKKREGACKVGLRWLCLVCYILHILVLKIFLS